MKRSEMAELLLKYDDELLPMQAEDIINFLESQGMQPPQREVKGGHLVPAEDGQEAMLTYSIVVNEWEPEND
jgi:predicted esterase